MKFVQCCSRSLRLNPCTLDAVEPFRDAKFFCPLHQFLQQQTIYCPSNFTSQHGHRTISCGFPARFLPLSFSAIHPAVPAIAPYPRNQSRVEISRPACIDFAYDSSPPVPTHLRGRRKTPLDDVVAIPVRTNPSRRLHHLHHQCAPALGAAPRHLAAWHGVAL